MNWTRIEKSKPETLPLNGIIVDTKIDDEKGCRNEQPLVRQGGLMFYPDRSMYVYYSPTHWRYQKASDE